MFISDTIPSDYKYIAEISDNYIVLVREDYLNQHVNYNAYYQFFNPSTQVLFTPKYRIKNYDTIRYDYNYSDTAYGRFIDYVEPSYTLTPIAIDEVSTDYFDRPDYWSIGVTVALFVALFIITFNLATSLIHRGGIFHA